jgi:RNA polymerase sigma-70 factor (ECF subfamily)
MHNLPHSFQISEETMAKAGPVLLAHRTFIRAVVKLVIKHPPLAEDACTDAMVAILEAWDSYDPAKPFGAWAGTIARNVARNILRRESRQPCPFSDLALDSITDDLAAAGDEAELELRCKALAKCVDRLPPRHRTLVRYRYWANNGYQALASRVGKTVQAIRAVIMRVHETLHQCIDRELAGS